VGQTSGGMGASQQLHKSEINVKMVELDQRDEPANVYAAKPNVN
jgi:HAE1 family hydrophobic/amphiphilic exporter-1